MTVALGLNGSTDTLTTLAKDQSAIQTDLANLEIDTSTRPGPASTSTASQLVRGPGDGGGFGRF